MNKTQEKVGCLTVILRLFGIDLAKAKSSRELPYRKRDDFLSAAERSFLGVLQVAIGTRAVLMANARRRSALCAARQGWLSWQNKIDRKHVDFVLCDPNTFQPLVAIELDDASHDRPNGAIVINSWMKHLRQPSYRSHIFQPEGSTIPDCCC